MSKINTETITLNDGNQIPQVGFGTFVPDDNDDGYESILLALKSGYRHLDTASSYNNEHVVGRAIRNSGIPREEIFVVTKLTGTAHRNPAAALDLSLKNLGLDYVDLYLMHWPVPITQTEVYGKYSRATLNESAVDKEWSHTKTWELMQELPKSKVKSIGVSNYPTEKFEQLFNSPTTKVVPAVNQVELHPYLAQDKLRDYAQKKGIILSAYHPLGKGSDLLSEPILSELAKKYGATPGQIVLSWGIARGYVILPKSSTPSRIESNINTIELSKEDVEKITDLSRIKPQRLTFPGFEPGIFSGDDDF